VAYFVLLVSVVNTPRRLFCFLTSIAVFTVLLTGLAVLHYHNIIDLPALAAVVEYDLDEFTGLRSTTRRLCATGIFNDPNDLSMIIVASMGICGFGIVSRPLGFIRFGLAAPLAFLGYGLALTHSRGGLLALIVGCAVLFQARFGWRRAWLAASVAIPAILVVFRGRQTDFAGALSGGGTGESRSELWSEGLQHLKHSPITGIGCNRFAEEVGLVAHNSFVHCFTELGLVGGSMFLGLFLVVGYSVWRLRRVKREIASTSLCHMHPYLLALLFAYIVSMLSLSRSYVVPTYLVAGLGVVYERLARKGTSLPPLRFGTGLMNCIVAGSIGFIVLTYAYIQVTLRWW
jgi:O-antigen ligase